MKLSSSSSTEGKGILARNTLVNVMGRGIPLLFAVIAIPFVIDGLGTERFGVLTIVWIVIGYFGLFDMGLGRATTKFVADEEARGGEQLSPIIITSILLLIAFGVVGGMLITIATPYLVEDLLNIPQGLTGETQKAFYILSASIPLVLGSVGARGVLEAQQRFTLVNAVKIPASTINYVGPLLVLPFSNQLHHVVLLLALGRAVSFVIYLYYSWQGQEYISPSEYPFVRWAKELLSFGAWLTISNFISPIMVYMDRFILGAILTMSAVAYYTTPYEMVTRLGIISSGFMGVMFPAFSVYSLKDDEKLVALHQKSIRYLFLAMVPIVTFLILTAEPLLYYWLGSEFAENSTLVLQILAAGVLINSIAMVPSTAIQAVGRPDIRAKLHMVELPIYLALIWFLARSIGVVGVAVAWVLRVAIDGAMLLYFCNRLIPFMRHSRKVLFRQLLGYVILFGLLLTGYYFIVDRIFLLAFGGMSAVLSFFLLWSYTLREEERNRIMNLYHELKEHVLSR
ncbi:flippase [Fodinibius sediminis]|uniref:Membrane protein involved in the export of O-antigen and teichoic acid n=1 Tax=Fodinibius sediminis TaxID=1214077 RepID=A0A521BWF9_9BACT|nr:flippase [Fodinibius sediminis]SMO50941.1 Membrane protein involved in the export of O-antigen and teichoic acid [Fodinibius sediminis]